MSNVVYRPNTPLQQAETTKRRKHIHTGRANHTPKTAQLKNRNTPTQNKGN